MQLTYIFTGRTGKMLLFFFIFIESLQAQKKQARVSVPAQKAVQVLTYKIIPGAAHSFGYDVYANGRLQVHQPLVPAVPGNKGFATKAAAGKVARLVIKKIRKGEIPPTISMEELRKLKVI